MMRFCASRVKVLAAAWTLMLVTTVDAFSSTPIFYGRSLSSRQRRHCKTSTPIFYGRNISSRQRRRCKTCLELSSQDSDAEGSWETPNDFRFFLTQCSIQSFMFLLSHMRDPQTVFWLAEFTQPAIVRRTEDYMEDASNFETGEYVEPEDPNPTAALLRYHGLAAMNTTLFPSWEDYYRQLLEEPAVTYSIESSKAHIPSYDLDIDPASICSRMLSVREQIAREFSHDLVIIANMGGHTLESYWENLKSKRDDKDDDDEGNDGATARGGIERQNLLFLEMSATQDDDYLPSPLRKGNFDLLVLLATQESIHRVLNDDSRTDGAERVTNDFLKNFYQERVASHFTGSQRYGRADDFLEELLLSSPRMIQLDDDVTSLIDPTRIAELILTEREKVCLEWKEIAEASPVEHTDIRRLQLNRAMGVCDEEDDDICSDWQ